MIIKTFYKVCGRPVCSANFTTSNNNKRYCSDSCRESHRQRNARIRFLKRIHDYFGNKCVICGFDDVRALQIDHVNGGGMKENKKRNNGIVAGGLQFYKIVLREINSGKYQLICANCNWIKRHTNNEK
jgi:RNase P subunit RPR2